MRIFFAKLITSLGLRNQTSGKGKLLASAANLYLRGYWNEVIDDQTDNGESSVLKYINNYFGSTKIVVFDVGANRGQWASNCLKECANAMIHSFELFPETFKKLQILMQDYPSVKTNSFGLSDRTSDIEATYYPDSDTGSSITPLPWHLSNSQVVCKTMRGIDYCQKNSIQMIHLLKIDTEGHEINVLNGFKDMLSNNQIACIQFEYGKTWLPPRYQLRDAYDILQPNGFTIGRLYPKGVKFMEYSMIRDENFRVGNFIAIHKKHQELITMLQLKH